jgi:hypothetical protein
MRSDQPPTIGLERVDDISDLHPIEQYANRLVFVYLYGALVTGTCLRGRPTPASNSRRLWQPAPEPELLRTSTSTRLRTRWRPTQCDVSWCQNVFIRRPVRRFVRYSTSSESGIWQHDVLGVLGVVLAFEAAMQRLTAFCAREIRDVPRYTCHATHALRPASLFVGLTDQPLTRPGAITRQQRDATRRAVRGASAPAQAAAPGRVQRQSCTAHRRFS